MATQTQDGVRIASIDPVRVYVARATAAGFGPQFIGPVVGPLFDRLADQLREAGLSPDLPAIAWYVALDDDQGQVQVNASFSAGAGAGLGPVEGQAFEVVELPAIEQAAVVAHVGPPDTIGEGWMALSDWLPAHGYAPAGPGREVYLSGAEVPMEEWVTELQYPVRAEG